VKTGNGNLSFCHCELSKKARQSLFTIRIGSIYKTTKNILKNFPKKEGFLEFIIVYKNSK